ncbi:MAG: hypothetical protein ABFD18_06430 [Syntrophomonas sp.]
MFNHNFSINQELAGIGVHNKGPLSDSHYPLLDSVLELMKDRGFKVGRDPQIQKDYECLNKDHWYGRKGALEFKAHRYPAGFSIDFFQNIIFENEHGGFYDFDKYEKMPYLIKLMLRNEFRYIKKFLEQAGCKDVSKPVYKLAVDKIKQHYVESCHSSQKSMEEFELEDLNGQTDSYSFNNTDLNNKTIYNGQVKYFRDHKGRLMRGKVYHNINNMWWIILNNFAYTNIADFELFDLTPENNARKVISKSGHHNPKSRWNPTAKEINTWQTELKASGKEGRIKAVNEFLEYLYSIDWMTRCFQFVLKGNGRLGLVETKGAPCYGFLGIPRKETAFNPPKKIPLYPKPKKMSSTEAGWIEGLREYVVHGPGPRVSAWFCRDNNGEGNGAYHWPDVREKLVKIGAMVISVDSLEAAKAVV